MLQGSTVRKLFAAALVLVLPVLVLGAKQEEKRRAGGPQRAIAVIHPIGDSGVLGVVAFTQKGDVVEVRGTIQGLKPGKHAFHVHQWGDCSSRDGMAAGGHFNPDMKHHGGPDSEDRHVGDLGNITAGPDGVANIDITDKVLSLQGGHSIIGRSVIVHAGVDDLKSDPAGNAGGRIGCGVIGIANPNPTPTKK
jgi:Cu-Zn family superoxide dismutase